MFECPRHAATDGACALTGCNNCPARLYEIELATRPARQSHAGLVLIMSILALGAIAIAGYTLPATVHEVNVAESGQ